ncbi:unnamed protein product, partial [Closterium sp. Naga37s-1]
ANSKVLEYEKLLQEKTEEIARLKNAAAETSANEEMQDQIDKLTQELEEQKKTHALEAHRVNSKLLESEQLLQKKNEELNIMNAEANSKFLDYEKILQDKYERVAKLENASAETSAANEEMQDQIDKLTQEIEEQKKTHALEAHRVNSKLLESEKLLQKKIDELNTLNTECSKLKTAAAEMSATNKKMQDQIDKLTDATDRLSKELVSRRDEVEQKESELKNLKGLSQTDCELKAEIARLKSDLADRNQVVGNKDRQLLEMEKNMKAQLQEMEKNMKAQLLEMEKKMKALHNRLLLLQGNIRVFCRVRPLSAKEGERSSGAMAVRIPENNIDNRIAVQGHEGDFKFDKVFSPGTTQTVVFKEIADLVTSALDGYKTGSGKTFTMFGDNTDETLRGVIPRSMHQIFQVIREKFTTGWEYTIQVRSRLCCSWWFCANCSN